MGSFNPSYNGEFSRGDPPQRGMRGGMGRGDHFSDTRGEDFSTSYVAPDDNPFTSETKNYSNEEGYRPPE